MAVVVAVTAQKMKFSTNDSFSKCDQTRSFLRIWSHLLKKSLMENFIFCAVSRSNSIFILLIENFLQEKNVITKCAGTKKKTKSLITVALVNHMIYNGVWWHDLWRFFKLMPSISQYIVLWQHQLFLRRFFLKFSNFFLKPGYFFVLSLSYGFPSLHFFLKVTLMQILKSPYMFMFIWQ